MRLVVGSYAMPIGSTPGKPSLCSVDTELTVPAVRSMTDRLSPRSSATSIQRASRNAIPSGSFAVG